MITCGRHLTNFAFIVVILQFASTAFCDITPGSNPVTTTNPGSTGTVSKNPNTGAATFAGQVTMSYFGRPTKITITMKYDNGNADRVTLDLDANGNFDGSGTFNFTGSGTIEYQPIKDGGDAGTLTKQTNARVVNSIEVED